MKPRIIVFCLAAALLAAAPAFSASDAPSVVKSGTPEAQRAMAQLKEARYADKMNAQSYTSEDNAAGMYYVHKQQQIDEILKRLQKGETVPVDDVKRALDNSHAVRYGGE